MERVVNYPQSTFGQVSQPQVVDAFVNSGAASIAAGDVCTFSYDTATGVLSVKQADVSADDPALVAGVALDAADQNEVLRVVTHGFAIVNIGDATVAAGERAAFHATADGAADSAAADATTVAGDTFGVMLSAEIGTSNTAAVWID